MLSFIITDIKNIVQLQQCMLYTNTKNILNNNVSQKEKTTPKYFFQQKKNFFLAKKIFWCYFLFLRYVVIFSIVKNKNDRAKDLTHDLSLISKWVFKWKMLFKPAQEVMFSRRKGDSAHRNIFLMICQQKELHTKNEKFNFKFALPP